MNKLLIVIFLSLIHCYPGIAIAQTKKALVIGDKVPDIILTNVKNYKGSIAKISDFKGKLLILDFWTTYCGSCVEAFPKMHDLQKEFNSDLQIFLVNTTKTDDINRVKTFFEKRKESTGESVNLPYSLLQTSLIKYFPYRFVPHYVWIDKTGEIIAITMQNEVTKQNIKAVLEGNIPLMHTKNDNLNFDNLKPLFVNGNGGDENHTLYKSIFTNYQEGLGNSEGTDRTKDGKITRLSFINTSLLGLLQNAYPGKLKYPNNRIIKEVKNGSKFMYGTTQDTLMYKNAYCYEITVPPTTREELQNYMQEDIYRIFHIRVKSEQRSMPCIILKNGKNTENIITKNGLPKIDVNAENTRKFIQNQPVRILISLLNNLKAADQVPIINESGMSQFIDIEFPANIFEMDLNSLKYFLKNVGFEVLEEERKIDVAVIVEK